MLKFKIIRTSKQLGELSKRKLVDFLYRHLDKFRDPKSAILKCINYAFSNLPGKGGFLLLAYKDRELAGAVVMNKTGMAEYIPEYVLVYIAVDCKFRNQGIGTQLIKRAKKLCGKQAIKLHVEYDNPAIHLYEREGFHSKYAEMRYIPGHRKPRKKIDRNMHFK